MSTSTKSSSQNTLGSFQLTTEEIERRDGTERIFLNEYQDIGEGRLYKGEWKKVNQYNEGNKVTMEQDGVGI